MSQVLFFSVDVHRRAMVDGIENVLKNVEKLVFHATQNGINIVGCVEGHRFEATSPVAYDESNPYTLPGLNSELAVVIDEEKSVDECGILCPEKALFVKKFRADVFRTTCMESILHSINPAVVVVFGMLVGMCVNFAVCGLLKRGYNVIVVSDAVNSARSFECSESCLDGNHVNCSYTRTFQKWYDLSEKTKTHLSFLTTEDVIGKGLL